MQLVNRDIPRRIQFEITHKCNKMCELCDHRIRFSDYEGMTRADYEHTMSYLNPLGFRIVDLIGGEPLVHPDFDWFARRLRDDFVTAQIRVRTNGKLVPDFYKRDSTLFNKLTWIVQRYPGFNDAVCETFGDMRNVRVKPFQEFWNPYRDPGLDEATARAVRLRCNYHVRIVGRRLYNCCLAESVERYYQTDPVHVEMSKSWRQDWMHLPTWRACQHCFRAIDWFGEEEKREDSRNR